MKDATDIVLEEVVDGAVRADAREEGPIEEDGADAGTSSDGDDSMKITPTRDSMSPEIAAIINEIYGVENW